MSSSDFHAHDEAGLVSEASTGEGATGGATLPSDTRAPARPGRPPGPPAHFLKGHLSDIWRDPLGFFTACARTYGDIALIRLGPRDSYLLSNPQDIAQVLVTENRKFIKHPAMSVNRYLLGNGLLVSEGSFWLRQRRTVQPAFHRERLALYRDTMVGLTRRMLDTWRPGQVADMHRKMMHLTVRIVAKGLFDTELGDAVDEVERAQQEVMDAYFSRYNSIFFLLSERIPVPANRRIKRASLSLRAILEKHVLGPRPLADGREDLLEMLLLAQDQDEGMSDRQLRDEVMNFFLAGHETPSNGLAWVWYLLAQHPEVEARLHAEVDAVLGGRAPTVEDVPRLRFTEMIVTEALRLYPPLWVIGRQALEDCDVGGYRLPAGSMIQMSQWVVHRDPRFYPDPNAFRPERWAERPMKTLPKYAYFPFGGGARMCIGHSFAALEMILVIAMVAQRFRLAVAPGFFPIPLPSMTLRPANGVRMIIQGRAPGERRLT